MSEAAPRPRPRRSLTAQLASVVLGFEAIVVFLGGLTIYGLRALPAGVEPWWGIVGGAVVAVVMLLTCGFVSRPAGIVVGWALQVIVALAAFLVPGMLLVALVFGGMWAFATIQGPRIERRAQGATPEGE
ncbi:DUF4233 domain-containing protein [Microbacterium sp. NPDC078428]|uniref:DUF4233 domain-containing protein n=1 Tax=Microbacterium sp. NPDC078428 TaxID=3364190 RepID=UPI0037C6A0F2